MLKMGTKTINMSAASIVDINEQDNTGRPVMYMTGMISLSENKFDTSASVQDSKLYDQYYDEVERDYAEFRALVKEERDRLSAGMGESD